MCTTQLADTTHDADLEQQFLDVVCDDPLLLSAEFEAIVATEWDQPPTRRPGWNATDRCPDGGVVGRGADRPSPAQRDRTRRPGDGQWWRQRSPPACRTAARGRRNSEMEAATGER